MNIAILYTGGTIGSYGTPLSPMGLERFCEMFCTHILQILQKKHQDIQIDFLPFDRAIDSTDLVPTDWCDILDTILLSYDRYDGFVILHGTDTMAYTSSMLSFMTTDITTLQRLQKPIILTGAMYPLFCSDSTCDTHSLDNICGAIDSIYRVNSGVYLYFANTLYIGTKVYKHNSTTINAFRGKIVDGVKNATYTTVLTIQDQLNTIKKSITNINILSIYPHTYNSNIISKIITSYIDYDVDAIILHSFGNGNFPYSNDNENSLKKAIQKGIYVLNSTQLQEAYIDSTIYKAGSWLSNIGVIDTQNMTQITSYTKMLYLLSLKTKKDDIKRLLLTNIANELD